MPIIRNRVRALPMKVTGIAYWSERRVHAALGRFRQIKVANPLVFFSMTKKVILMIIYNLTWPPNMISVSHLHFRPENVIYPLNCLFQMAGKSYPRAGKRLVGHTWCHLMIYTLSHPEKLIFKFPFKFHRTSHGTQVQSMGVGAKNAPQGVRKFLGRLVMGI